MTIIASIVFVMATTGQPVSQGSIDSANSAVIETQDVSTTSLASLHLDPESLKWGNMVNGVKISLSVLPKNSKIDFVNRPILAITVCNSSQSTLAIQEINGRIMLSIFTVLYGVPTFLYPKQREVTMVGEVQIKPNEMMSFAYPFDIQSYDPQYVPLSGLILLRNHRTNTHFTLMSNVVSGDDISKNVK